MAKTSLCPRDATNEGSRRLRELLRRHTFVALARRLRCDEGAVRYWASERGKPGRSLRARIAEVLEIEARAWNEPPSFADPYADGKDEPPTRPRPSSSGTRVRV